MEMAMRARAARRANRLAAVAAAAVAMLVLTGCPPQPPSSGSDPRLDMVDPHETDPTLPSEPDAMQFSIRPSTTGRQRLVVLFNGTGSVPSSMGRVGRSLAAEGFHVIGLRYESGVGTLEACPNAMVLLDPECHRRLRSEVVFGANVPGSSTEVGYDHLLLNVNERTAVMNRLLAYVEHLAATRPDEGWGNYLMTDGDGTCVRVDPVNGRCTLDWGNVVALGYSQGAGVALYLSKYVDLDRLGMISGSFDAFGVAGDYVAAPWLYEPFATDKSGMALLIHAEESHAGRERAVAEAVGLDDLEVDVTTTFPPYWGSRRLVTTEQPTCAFPPADWAHTAAIGNSCTPQEHHIPAWTYLAGGF
jgi:hypothetical protein